MKKQLIIGHILSLLFGCFIYISFRQDTLIMFNWLDRVNILEVISVYRLFSLPLAENLPNWFLYSLPDGLWLFSYISILLVIWRNVISKQNIHWVLIVPLIAIVSEIGQLIKLVPGTFDIVDICFYLSGTIVPILLFANPKTNKPITT